MLLVVFYVFNVVLRVLQLYDKAILLLKIRCQRDANIILPCPTPFALITFLFQTSFLNLRVFIRVIYRNMAERSFRGV